MRLISITVRNYRLHRDLKVELDPLRTLISGPNECGKSTLMEAAHRALFLRAKTTGDLQKGMISRVHGGHPEVEVVFDSGGVTYRVLKRFSGATGTTSLADLSGKSWSGDEAEMRLAGLLGVEAIGGGRGAGERVLQQWAHLWVRQGTSGENPTQYATAQHDSLLARLQGGGASAAMQSELDVRVASRIRSLEELVMTQTGAFRANSAPAVAVADHAAAMADLTQAKVTMEKLVEAANGLQESLKTIDLAEASLLQLRPQLAAIEAKLAQVSTLRSKEQTQQLVLTSAIEKHEALEQAEAGIVQLRTDLQGAKEALAPKELETERLSAAEAELRERHAKTEEVRQQAGTAVRLVRLRFDLAEAYLRHIEKAAQRDQIAKNLERIRDLRTDCGALEARAALTPAISAEHVKKLQKLESDCSKAEAALSAMATGIEIIATNTPVYLGEKAFEAGDSHVLTEEADLTIGPDVRIRIRPGGGITLTESRRSLNGRQEALQQELDTLGLKTVAEAVEACAKHQHVASEIRNARSLLENLGAATIDGEFAVAQNACLTAEAEVDRRRELVPEGIVPPRDAAEATLLIAQLRKEFSEAEAAEATSENESKAADKALQKGVQRLVDHRQSLQEVIRRISDGEAQLRLMVETHGEDSNRKTKLAELLGSRTEAEGFLGNTQRLLEELQPALLEADRPRLIRALEQQVRSKTEAEQNRAVYRSELQRDGSGDPQADLALAEAKVRAADERRVRAERKAGAVHLLHELFREEQRNQAEELSRPFAVKISGYLECLFGIGASARVSLENNAFSELELVRPAFSAGAFNFESLSGGTCEQLAAAVRLAMAEVLAETHDGCLPIVFDDAFVNSDPERLQMLQRMLDHASSAGLQIIVLTCDPSDYAAFGARAVSLPEIARC